jgi:hypothetical protein
MGLVEADRGVALAPGEALVSAEADPAEAVMSVSRAALANRPGREWTEARESIDLGGQPGGLA